jgi:hypothetical protein
VSQDIFEGFCWHSSIGIDSTLEGNKTFVTRLPNTRQAMAMFTASGNNLLIHKTTRCLWKMSEDKKTIEPVFSSDVLSAEDVKEAMEGSEK